MDTPAFGPSPRTVGARQVSQVASTMPCGSVLSAGMLGEINGVVAFLSNDIVARAVVFGVVILIIVLKPKGLFSFKER